jgi:crotonobetainyl-CoA:carnitine CoA-transferase CaiB-like acyl-CoA transferase
VNNLAQALEEPQLLSRGMVTETGGDDSMKIIASPINITGWAKRKPWLAKVDEHGENYRKSRL